jgi:O-antigen biosynthesis protein
MPVDVKKVRSANGAPAPTDVIPGGGRVEALSVLGGGALLALVSSAAIPTRRSIRGWLMEVDQQPQRLTGWRLALQAEARTRGLALLVLQAGGREGRFGAAGQLVLEADERHVALEPADLGDAEVDLNTFGSTQLGTLDPMVRLGLLDEIVGLLGRRKAGIRAVAPALQTLRDSVRPRFPAAEVHAGVELSAQVDGLFQIDERAFYVEGWIVDRAGALASLRLLTPEGRILEIAETAYRYPRPDVSALFGVPERENLGFIVYVEVPEGSFERAGWILQAQLSSGRGIEAMAPAAGDNPFELRSHLLGGIDLDGPDDRLKRDHLRPALSRLEARLSSAVEIDSVDQHGELPTDPDVSIVVPLYRRIDYVEHQLAQFVHDPEMVRADLIYVLDSPEDASTLRRFAGHLHELYGVPFRLVCLSANGGFSTANNLGASQAIGRHLLLLNSDVLPREPGWLSRLVEFYEANADVGVLAPKLLYEDESIQHAGLFFDRPGGETTWSNEHFYKGLHRDFPAANVARKVPGVTGACLLIALDLWRELGGFQGGYLRGDYEDSDLCLRVQEKGRECWYLPDVELYHLEGQSYPSTEREAASRYNRWLQTAAWSSQIAAWR